MPCSIVNTTRQEHSGLILENDHISVEVLPAFGGRIWTLRHRRSDRNWIWRNPNTPLAACPPGSNYDDNWAGGWEELFPNDAPGNFMGRTLPDHGEWWSREWAWEPAAERSDQAGVRMWLECPVSETFCEKWLTICEDASELEVRYRIRNNGRQQLFFLFKQHLAVAVQAGDHVELPGGDAVAVDPEFSSLVIPDTFTWPVAAGKGGRKVDVSLVPPASSPAREFLYVWNLPAGWCGVFSPASRSRLRLFFDTKTFPYTWLFMTYGGWRNLHTVVLEPCTNMPKSLHAAMARGSCAGVLPGSAFECSVRVALSEQVQL